MGKVCNDNLFEKSMIKEEVRWMDKLKRFLKKEEGATAVEYGIMVALIAAVIIAVVVILGTKLSSAFQNVASKIS